MKDTGRPLPIDYHLDKHRNAMANIKKLRQHFKNNPNVDFFFVDNSLGENNARIVPFEEIEKEAYLSGDASEQLHDTVENLHQSGKISEPQYRALTAANTGGVQKTATQREGDEAGSNDGQQPQQSS